MKETAIVTGGSRGIGFAIAKQLSDDGFNVVIMATGAETDYARDFARLGDYLYVQGNICVPGDRERLVREAVKRFGGIHVLVNNAGVAPKVRGDLLEMTEESFDRVIGINTKGTMFLTQIVSKQMLRQEYSGKKRGIIVNVSSCSAEVSSIGRGEYCVSKAGLSMLTTLYADRLASEAIFVYEVRPGVIDTDMTAAVKEKYDKLFAAGAFPIARWGQPQDVADAVSAFAGGKFLYSTGSYIDIDGGFHIKRL
ncbi:3-ketoacyl-ACP reductase [Clostridia bacterium]|nr:3-ketoacyl-ACP reductase [Clostridia bacterium]